MLSQNQPMHTSYPQAPNDMLLSAPSVLAWNADTIVWITQPTMIGFSKRAPGTSASDLKAVSGELV